MKDIVEITKEEAESFIGKPINEEEIRFSNFSCGHPFLYNSVISCGHFYRKSGISAS